MYTLKHIRFSIITALLLAGRIVIPDVYGQQLQAVQLLTAPVFPQLKTAGIRTDTVVFDENKNYTVGLYGEKVPEQIISVVSPRYNIDWSKETIKPVIYFKSVPLRDPKLLMDKEGRLVIFVADIGNHGPKGQQMAGVFSDNDVVTLRKELSAIWGPEKKVREKSYTGAVYIWKKNGVVARLTIENELLDGNATETRNGVKQDGRNGKLTIYNQVQPAFYSKSEDYFNDPEIRKNTTPHQP
ncbi:hypothetical protein [Chitinophaga qingshengii]|uniref:Uncharacterized protein n=1 Tax=Chitinophaga qingshengii TaxID=1569794 RepID=A0ABR7TQE9_9BACT|nr:hypothetical protein [Chitinophaga qingshengii]MBC9931813.1 hypothetical protein [Chitinophaga qingshengii]